MSPCSSLASNSTCLLYSSCNALSSFASLANIFHASFAFALMYCILSYISCVLRSHTIGSFSILPFASTLISGSDPFSGVFISSFGDGASFFGASFLSSTISSAPSAIFAPLCTYGPMSVIHL